MAKPSKPPKIPDPPSPGVWNSAPVLTPAPSTAVPEVISDGGGLPFHRDAVDVPFEPLDPSDPPVIALLDQIERGRKRAQPSRLLRPKATPPPMDDATKLQGWRIIAQTDDEILYARGRPPRLLTVAVRRGGRGKWECIGVSSARPLRAVREGSRASSWRLDPTQPATPESTELRILLTEQSKATGVLADDRLLTPELYLDDDRVVLRLYVRPLDGYVGGTRRHETPVIVKLPEPLGDRPVVDGALYEPS